MFTNDRAGSGEKSNTLLKGLQEISTSLVDRVLSKKEVALKLCEGLKAPLEFSDIQVFLLSPSSSEIDLCHPKDQIDRFPKDFEWIVHYQNTLISQELVDQVSVLFLEKERMISIDKNEVRKETKNTNPKYPEGAYILLTSDDREVFCIIFAKTFQAKPILKKIPAILKKIKPIKNFLVEIALALDNLYIHHKIENLLSDKNKLTQRIQRDEEDLKRRILELSVLYDTSNALGYSLNYNQIVSLVLDSLGKVLNYDICSIFLIDFIPGGEIISRMNKDLHKGDIKEIYSNVLSAITPFIKKVIDPTLVKKTIEEQFFPSESSPEKAPMRSFANVPLIFKEEVIGILNICSSNANVFGRNEMTFLHTMANLITSNLGRLKIVKRLEKSKIDSLIKSMTDGVIMVDKNLQIEVINPAALTILDFEAIENVSDDRLRSRLEEIGLQALYNSTAKSKKPIVNQIITYNDKIFSVNSTPVFDNGETQVGTAFVFRDSTEIHKINRINIQRLEVISKVSLILKSITDLNSLLTVLMESILNVANAEMGSIQLFRENKLHTKVHSNFPDKIRKQYRYKDGKTITEVVEEKKEHMFIEEYFHNPDVNPNVKILIDWYLCIPILVKEELIGVVNIARKYGSSLQKLTPEDISTLTTITALCGTAINNSLHYKERLENQKLEQELRIATDIQTKLLPEKLPQYKDIGFGAFSNPARQIGGDYYDFFNLDDGNLGIVVADIVGKGVPAGLLMATLKSLLSTHMQSFSSPKMALERLNQILVKDPVLNKFIPLFYGILDPQKRTFRYCNAGHEPAILFTEGKFEDLDTEGFPLGGLPDSQFEEKTVTLKENDIVLIFTDGIVEARNPKGENFGLDRIKSLIKTGKNLDAEALVKKAYTQVVQFTKTNEQHDDLTIVSLKVGSNQKIMGKIEEPSSINDIKVTSAKENIKEIRKLLETICKEIGFKEEEIFNIKLAVNEAHANVIEHAYFGNEDGEIQFKVLSYDDRIEIMIRDFGTGVGQKTIKGEEKHLDELEGSGLGEFLIKSVMDKVKYEKRTVGTELWLTKYK